MKMRRYHWHGLTPETPVGTVLARTDDIVGTVTSVRCGAAGEWGTAVVTLVGSNDGVTFDPILDGLGQPLTLSADGEVETDVIRAFYAVSVSQAAAGYELEGFIHMEVA